MPSPDLARRALALALVVLAAAACEVSGSIGAPRDTRRHPGKPGFDVGVNIPTVGLAPDGFGFAVRGRGFTAEQTYGPTVYTPDVGVGVAIWGYGGGAARVEIRDAGGRVVLVQRLTSNIAQGSSTTRGAPPFTVHLTFEHFTGDLSLGVGPADD